MLQHVIDKRRQLKAPLYLCFVDLKSAYDRVLWPRLWGTLQRLGIHARMLDAIRSLYTNYLLYVRLDGMHGQGQTPSMGLRQGCPLSATLFGFFIHGLHHYYIYLESVVPVAGVTVGGMQLRELVDADDVYWRLALLTCKL